MNFKRIFYQRHYSCKIFAIEYTTSYTRHAVGDGDGGKAGATTKRITSYARHAVGDGDGGKAGAIIERHFSNARDNYNPKCSFVT